MKSMKNASLEKVILWITLILVVLLGITSLNGLLTPEFYKNETLNWRIQAIGQDVINLSLIVPVLIVSAIFSKRGNKTAPFIWAGAIQYLLYTFLIYCFDVHFNNMFLIYCLILGITFYAFNYFMYLEIRKPPINITVNTPVIRGTAIYFLILPFIFYLLWLAEIIPAIIHSIIPASVSESGLFTNPVHVIDLSVFLPGIFVTGILLYKRKILGYILAPIILTFFILMDLTIAYLIFAMNANGIYSNTNIAVVMISLAIVSAFLLIRFMRFMSDSNKGNELLAGMSPLEVHKTSS
jgi:hypothetical protein